MYIMFIFKKNHEATEGWYTNFSTSEELGILCHGCGFPLFCLNRICFYCLCAQQLFKTHCKDTQNQFIYWKYLCLALFPNTKQQAARTQRSKEFCNKIKTVHRVKMHINILFSPNHFLKQNTTSLLESIQWKCPPHPLWQAIPVDWTHDRESLWPSHCSTVTREGTTRKRLFEKCNWHLGISWDMQCDKY